MSHRTFLWSGLIVCISLLLLWLGASQLTERRVWRTYQRALHLTPADMTYRSVDVPIGGDGVLLYDVTFPRLGLALKADKVLLKRADHQMMMTLYGARLDVLSSLRQRYADELESVLTAYALPHDVFRHPLITLALMHVDEVSGEVRLGFIQKGEQAQLQMEFRDQEGTPVLRGIMDMVLPSYQEPSLFGFLRGHVSGITFIVPDGRVLERYRRLAQQMNIPLSEEVRQAIRTHVPFQMTYFLNKTPLMDFVFP